MKISIFCRKRGVYKLIGCTNYWKFYGIKFVVLNLCSICEILTVDNYSMNKCLESFYSYYKVLGEPAIAGCSCQSDVYSWGVELGAHLFNDRQHINIFFAC